VDGGAIFDRALLILYFSSHVRIQCFWHIQHEFIDGERSILGRDDHQLTSAAGYAGGTSTDKEGRVCYHNFQGAGDYGKMGHGEVVGMTIPQSKVQDFAALYFSLFNPKTKGTIYLYSFCCFFGDVMAGVFDSTIAHYMFLQTVSTQGIEEVNTDHSLDCQVEPAIAVILWLKKKQQRLVSSL
jgi:hypothetical protein